MTKKYTAFISYRHCPLDTMVAERLHKQIERYRVPKDLRKNDQKNLGVVFRDRDELPLSNNLTEDIYEALDHSQFLIVVCTPETPKSMWVDREIQHFVEKHGHSRILTVLAAGTPEESIPKRIINVYGADGKTVVGQVEPLCAYLVGDSPKDVLRNLKSEFLRLAAAILDCPYDALKQRQKRYRTRRLIAAISAAAAVMLTIMVLLVQWNLDVRKKNKEIEEKNLQIQEQLQQTQLKESQALTLLSENQLEEGNRMAALESAIQALPGQEETRPFYAPAETALEKALGLYQTNYFYDAQIKSAFGLDTITVSGDGRYAAGVSGQRLACYDLYTETLLWEIPQFDTYAVRNFQFLPELGTVLCTDYGGGQYILDQQTGELRFSYAFGRQKYPMGFSPDHTKMAVSYEGKVAFCSLEQEQIVWSAPVDAYASGHSCVGSYSADGSRFLMMCTADFGDGKEIAIRVLDPADGSVISGGSLMWPTEEVKLAHILGLDNGEFFLSFTYAGSRICCRFSRDGDLLTAGDFAFDRDGTQMLFYKDQEGVAVQVGDDVYIISYASVYQVDAESCQLVKKHKLSRDQELCWFYEDGRYLVLENGTQLQMYQPDGQGEYELSRRWDSGRSLDVDDMVFVPENPDVFLIADDVVQVIRWNSIHTEQTLPIELKGNLVYLPKFCGVYPSPSGESLFILDTDPWSADGDRQYLYRISDGQEQDLTVFPGHRAVFSADETKLLWQEGVYDLERDSVDNQDMEVVTVRRNDQIAGEPVLAAAYEDGVLYGWMDGESSGKWESPWPEETGKVLAAGQNRYVLLQYGEEAVSFEPGEFDSYHVDGDSEYYIVDGEYYYVNEEYTYAVCNTKNGQWQQVELPIKAAKTVALGRKKPLAAFTSENGDLYVYDLKEKKLLLELERALSFEVDIQFLKQDSVLMILDESGYTFLDVRSGEILNAVNAQFTAIALGEEYLVVQEKADGSRVYISNALGEYPGLVINTEDWSVEWEVEGMLCYLPAYDAIVCTDINFERLVLYPKLSVEEMITTGQKLLAGQRD